MVTSESLTVTKSIEKLRPAPRRAARIASGKCSPLARAWASIGEALSTFFWIGDVLKRRPCGGSRTGSRQSCEPPAPSDDLDLVLMRPILRFPRDPGDLQEMIDIGHLLLPRDRTGDRLLVTPSMSSLPEWREEFLLPLEGEE